MKRDRQELLFFGTHNHTEFSNVGSFLDSVIKVKDLILKAHALGYCGIAFTEHGNICSHIQAITISKQLKKQGKIPQDFVIGLGVEAYIVDEAEMKEAVENNQPTSFYHTVIIAKDEIGHQQIRELVTRSYERSFTYRGILRVPMFYTDFKEVIGDKGGHLIATTACLGGFIGKTVTHMLKHENEEMRKPYKDSIYNYMCWAFETFGEDFYYELQPSFNEEQVAYNQMLVKIAKAYQVRLTVATDTHYLTKEDKEIHEAFLTSDKNGEGGRELGDFYNDTYLHTIDEMFEKLNYLDEDDVSEAIYNTQTIASQIKDYDLAHPQIVPTIPLPPRSEWIIHKEFYEMAKDYEYIQAMIDSNEIQDNYLINQVFKGFHEKEIPAYKYKEKLERLNIECKELLGISKVKEQPMSAYFVTLQKCMELIWEEAGSIIGVGRGSSVGWELNYLLNIVQISPLEQGIPLPHWRFLTSERIDLPDVDIDLPSINRQKVFDVVQRYLKTIGGDIVRVATFSTETAKSAIQTACRGKGINNDVAQHLSNLIPIERGKVRDLHTVYYGNDDVEPIHEFKRICDEYAHLNLIETAFGIEGLVKNRSIHSCGVIIVTEEFTKHNAKMVAPNGEMITSWSLGECEYVGNIKYDFLNVKTGSMIQNCLESLVEAGHLEWQGSLRKTYDKYLSPAVLDYDSEEMWNILKNGEALSAFQFETQMGAKVVDLIKPSNIIEVAACNTLMRLQTENEEQPMDMYKRYKDDINEWYRDMREFGLNEEEIEVMEELLLSSYGVMSDQETLMIASQHPKIANFSIVESNKLRKAIAKRKGDIYEEVHQLFYEKGLANGVRKVFLDYVWDSQISLSKGYSFSVLHCIAYSTILLQQLNLLYRYSPIYWNCSVLQVESGSLEQAELETEDDEDDASSNKKEKMTNYGVIATAISMLQKRGIKIDLPDINKAQLRFVPDEVNNSILFGLKGITKINTETAKTIIENRPYTSFNDFKERLVDTKREVVGKDGKVQNKAYVTNAQLVSLIKAGAFDSLEAGKTREDILYDYIKSIYEPKKSMSAKMIQHILELGFVPEDLMEQIRHYHFREFIKKLHNHKDETSKSIKWHVIETGTQEMNDYTTNYFETHFMLDLTEDKDYRFDENGRVQIALGTKRKGSFEDIYTQKTKELSDWLKSDDCLGRYNRMLLDELMLKHADGTKEKWEMESMSLYRETHECDSLRLGGYNIAQFDNLSEEPTIVGYNAYRNVQYPKFALSTLVGTVLDKDNNKHSITLLTQSGVVNVKFQAGQFNHYAKTISVINPETGKKTTVEESWFKKGKILFVTGYRSGQIFRAKVYKGGIVEHTVQLINRINEDGTFVISPERARID